MLTMNFIASICATIVLVSGGPMQTFEIDGNYYVDNAGTNIDWITVIDGCRIGFHPVCNANCGAIDGAWKECQSQCVQTGGINSQYWDSGVFCDTYGNGEQSLLKDSDIFDTFNWVPLQVNSAGPAKSDLTNIFYAGSSIDMIMCLAMERISPRGSSYVDFEFIQNEATRKPCLDKDGVAMNGTSYDWKCHYSNRTIDDIQVSFGMETGTTGFKIFFCRWRPDFGDAPYVTDGFNATVYFAERNLTVPSWLPLYDNPFCGNNGLADNPYWVFGWIQFVNDASGGVYTASSPTFRDAVDGAVNLGLEYHGSTVEDPKAKDYEQASPFGHIYSQNQDAVPLASLWMLEGTFMEACIDWQAIGFDNMCYDGLMVKTKSSSTGAPKDTGGFIPLSICGHTGMTFQPTRDTLVPTKLPSNVPTQPTASSAPTRNTLAPTTWSPTSFPTWNPTTEPTSFPSDEPTWKPTDNPTGETSAPTQPTKNPTPSPTVLAGDPSRAPTRKPTAAPTPHPTVRDGDPSRAPTVKPTDYPSDYPSIPPTDAPTVTPNCTLDDSWDRDVECVEPDGDGCSAQFSTTVAVCILNGKFERSGIFEYFKDAVIYVMESSPQFSDACIRSDAHITYYRIGYEDEAAREAAQARPQITRECVDESSECADDAAYQYTVTVHIGFFCPGCNVMRDIIANFAGDEESWRFAFPRALLGQSRTRDHVCSNGFGGVSLENMCAVYRNSDGADSGDTYGDCGVAVPTEETTPGPTTGDGKTDGAVMRQYYFVWILVAVFSLF